jgi:hypothetical protein
MFFEEPIKVHLYDYGFSPRKTPHSLVIFLLDMPETMCCKIILHEFEKRYFPGENGIFIFLDLAGDSKAFRGRDLPVVHPVLSEAGYMLPDHDAGFIRFAVEHVRINPAYRNPAVVDPAAVILQKPACAACIALRPECIAGNVESSCLVTKFRIGSRFDCIGIDRLYRRHIAIEEKDMPVPGADTAFPAGITMEPDLPDLPGEAFQRVLKEPVPFLHQGKYPEGYRHVNAIGPHFSFPGNDVGLPDVILCASRGFGDLPGRAIRDGGPLISRLMHPGRIGF